MSAGPPRNQENMKINKPLCWSIVGILAPIYGLYWHGHLMNALRISLQNTFLSNYIVNAWTAFILFCVVVIAMSIFIYIREMLRIAINRKRELESALVYLAIFAAIPIIVLLMSKSLRSGLDSI